MKIKKIVIAAFFFGYASSWANPKTYHLELSGLQLKNSIFEGEIVNKGNETAKEVWVHVAFKDSKGVTAFEQDFHVVPGGDGKSIPKGWSKHFRFELKLSGSAELIPVGFIKSVTIN